MHIPVGGAFEAEEVAVAKALNQALFWSSEEKRGNIVARGHCEWSRVTREGQIGNMIISIFRRILYTTEKKFTSAPTEMDT